MWRTALLAQRGHLMCWVPVCLGLGIGLYFALLTEPGPGVWITVALAVAALFFVSRALDIAVRPLCLGLAIAGAGFLLAGVETRRVADPILGFRYYGPIEGRLVHIDQSASEAVRLTLDRVRLDRMEPARTPGRVRVSLHGDQPAAPFLPGEKLILTGHLSPPAGPAEPGGFDFRRFAWFAGLGAIGYTQTPVLVLSDAAGDWGLAVFDLRMRISAAIQSNLPGDPGAFAAALIIGDRSGMSAESQQVLRDSNLYHVVSISGLHMGMLTSFIFMIVRVGLSLWPAVALRLSVKKIAAVAALLVGAVYLAMSGGDVATERSYIMVAVMLTAILLDRQALSLRGLAIAAIIIMVMHPHAMMGPGFQMSFAATAALVVAFRAIRGKALGPRWMRSGVTLVLSSVVAGCASAPFAAVHFNQISHYGLIANLLAVPAMGTIIMPAAVVAGLVSPFGLAPQALWVAGLGLRWTLFVAETVAGWEGATSHVKTPMPFVLPLLALSLLWCILWRGPARWGALVGVAAAGLLWVQTTRPTILVAQSGGVIGVLDTTTRTLSSATGDTFTTGVWLENDGAGRDDVPALMAETALSPTPRTLTRIGPWQILHLRGKSALATLSGCDGADVLISNQETAGQRPCLVVDAGLLRRTGSLAINLGQDDSLIITTAAQVAGQRPWHGPMRDQPALTLRPRADVIAASDPVSQSP